MNRRSIIIAFFLTLCAAAWGVLPVFSEKQKYTYVGIKECKTCHSADAIGNQYKIWESSPHAKSYRNLRTEKAKTIGESVGVKEPYKDQACLKCHTTGGGMDSKTAEEAVGCEACHGPASGYGDITNHAAYGDKQKDYLKAVSFGMYRILGLEGIKLRERMCKRCHTLERPCAPADPEERRRAELALSVIADFVFKHPLK
jgi:hypothetical protein